jgi:large subunit ribosomal protein L21
MKPNYAIIATGGKQCLVKVNETVKIEKLEKNIGETVEITEVLLVGDDETAEIGKPMVVGAVVVAEVVKQGRAKKVTGVKFRAKKREKVGFGHRQTFTELLIKDIKLA